MLRLITNFGRTVATMLMVASLFVLAAALVGCTAHPVASGTPAVGSNLGGARALGQFALANTVTLKGHVDPGHEPTRQTVANAMVEQDKLLTDAEKANDAEQETRAKVEHKLTTANQKYADLDQHYQHDFFSRTQARLLTYWIIAVIAGAILCGVGLMGATLVYVVCAYAGRVILCGTGVAPLLWAFDHLWLNKVTSPSA
jgi:hypothetical protein